MNRKVLLASLLFLPVCAQPPQAAPVPGRWEGALALPSGKLELIVDLWTTGDGWHGAISIPAQGAQNIALSGIGAGSGRLRFTLSGIPGEPTFEGTLDERGTSTSGSFTQGGARLPLTLRRLGETPAELRTTEEAKGSRPLRTGEHLFQFAGFNAFPLNATVTGRGAHSYFAVMVAGSGPTDRDWSNPLIPVSSHGGRDVAGWLQGQGLGSLRYDKRFIGAMDPKLDVSLDAQLGDVKAAMKAARALPEARGKKLLLVGHSEGALLSLLAAGEADAALLLAMPGESMGRVILAQVKGQLAAAGAPPEVSAENLAYLRVALDAIRTDQNLPKAAQAVAPSIVTLARGLARPESRGFVRDLLDLDPWVAAQRLPVPCAMVWGDRDSQTWKPEVVPPAYKGAVIQIPEANHLFKRETRERAGLSGAAAMSTYGDDTPLADLSPVAAWLKGLE